MNEPVKTASAQALARAMADTFSDDPAVWLLAVELAENQITIGEMLTVLSSTFPNALKSVE
jgi:rRNA processing protein Krr1/Pno1